MLPSSHYDRRRADRAVSFIQGLKHTKGVWAGKPFLLFPWQEQIIRDVFGTIKGNGYPTSSSYSNPQTVQMYFIALFLSFSPCTAYFYRSSTRAVLFA